MIAYDASVLIAHFTTADALHDRATELLQTNAADNAVVHSLTLAEILVGGVRTSSVSEMLADLRAVGIEVADRAPNEAHSLAELRVSTGLRMPGCCVLHVAQVHRARIATFDDRLRVAARRLHIDVVTAT